MKKLFALVAVLLAVCIVPNDVDAQTRKEKKASKKATVKSRGTKLVREECEELAMDITAANPRAAGNGVSANEMLATNMAMLDARSNISYYANVVGKLVNTHSKKQVVNIAFVQDPRLYSAGKNDSQAVSKAFRSQSLYNALKNAIIPGLQK